MIGLTNPATGHAIKVDEESVEFWRAAGYRENEAEAKKAPAKRSTSSSKSKK